MRFGILSLAVVLSMGSIACATWSTNKPLPTVQEVSLDKYVGRWYAVTSLPQFFTRRCVAQEAVYTLKSEFEISVQNICIKQTGARSDIKGYARLTSVPGVLKLKFTSGFAGFFGAGGDYNILKLDKHYRYALIGSKDRKSLWLLARAPSIDDKVYEAYISHAREIGFDVSNLVDSSF